MNRGIFTTITGSVKAAIVKAQSTADNARQMVLNRDVTLKDLQADAATIPDIIHAAATEHAIINEEWQTADANLTARIDAIELTPGPPGKDGRDGADGRNGTDGVNGRDGAASTGPGKDGRDGTNGSDGASAYQLARTAGYGGTLTQWLTSLVGPKGEPGTNATNQQIEYRDGIPVPAVLSLLGIAATVDVPITWSTQFADTNYTITKPQTTPVTAALIGRTDATVKAGTTTKTGCTITVTTTALLAVGNVTLSVLAYRKGQ